jgi:hypothetical protein
MPCRLLYGSRLWLPTDGVPLFVEEVTKMVLEMDGQRQGTLDDVAA